MSSRPECGAAWRRHGSFRPSGWSRREPPPALEPAEWPPSWQIVQEALNAMCEPQKGKTQLSPFELAVLEVIVESRKERSAEEVTEELAANYDRLPTRRDVWRVSAMRQRREEGLGR